MQFDSFLKVEITPPGDFLSNSPLEPPCSPTFSMTPLSATTPTPSGSSLSRKPSRKSTLTQQQKNAKRQRATQDQLLTLESEFCRNPTPTAVVRERIAEDIDMTERSVQIWFQNRRAKIKNLAKKSIETGEECEAIPESMRRYLALQAMESGKGYFGNAAPDQTAAAYGRGLLLNTESAASKVMIYHLACQSLNIGTWKRVGQTQLDLVVFYSPVKSMMTYYIQADGQGFRIEYPFSHIKNISIDNGDVSADPEGFASGRIGGLVIELNRPPIFSMDQGSGGWYQCRDFTEYFQASQVLVHYLGGHPKVLTGQLAKLMSLDAYQNRHQTFETSPHRLSVPADPIGFRPSSQPNHTTHPRMNLFPSHAFDIPAPPRGHKRQRSRSVPVAIDFSQFRPSKAPFTMQKHHHIHTHMPNAAHSQIYAPIPQHGPSGLAQQLSASVGPIGHVLSIDTSPGYGMDIPPCPPSSSTVGTSPPSSSEYEGSFLMPGAASDSFAMSQMNTPFITTFLSPLPEDCSNQPSPAFPMCAQSYQDAFNTMHLPDTPLTYRSKSRLAQMSYSSPEDVKIDMTAFDMANATSTLNFAPQPQEPQPVQQRPVEHTPVKQIPVDHMSAYQTPVQHTPLQHTPFQHAPAVPVISAAPTPAPAMQATMAQQPMSQQAMQTTPVQDLPQNIPLPPSPEPFQPEEANIIAPIPISTTSDLTNQTWLSDFPSKPFINDPDALMLPDQLLYDSYLTDPLVDPFFDALSNPLMQHPLHDPILESLHRHSRSKPSISTLVFRTFGEQHQVPPAMTPPTSSPQAEEFSYRHMVNVSEDFGSRFIGNF